jgi:hypothetical protein
MKGLNVFKKSQKNIAKTQYSTGSSRLRNKNCQLENYLIWNKVMSKAT